MEGLGIDLSYLLAQIINFFILFCLLFIVAYKPMMRMLDGRSKKIKESMEQTEYIKEQAAKAEEEVAKRIAEASKEGQKIIDRAVQSGEGMRLKAQQEAKREAETLIVRAQAEIEHERDDAISELRKAFADITIMAAGKVIDRTLDKEKHRQLIDKVLEESPSLKKG